MTLHYAAAAAVVCLVAQSPKMTFTTIARGDQSQVEEPRQVVARTAAEWAALWKQHASQEKPPAVDFARSMVIGVFLGTRPTAGFDVEILGIDTRGADLVVTYRERRPAPNDVVAQVLTAPFHLVQTAAHSGPVKFQRTP